MSIFSCYISLPGCVPHKTRNWKRKVVSFAWLRSAWQLRIQSASRLKAALSGEWEKFHPHHDHGCMIPFPHSLPKATQMKGFIFRTLFATSCHQAMFGKIKNLLSSHCKPTPIVCLFQKNSLFLPIQILGKLVPTIHRFHWPQQVYQPPKRLELWKTCWSWVWPSLEKTPKP